jgi:hypothetical protein
MKTISSCSFSLVLPPEHYWFLWSLSWLSLVSALYAVYRGYYDLACVPGGVWITSINYWRYPDYSWRRYVDIAYVHIALVYQALRAYNAEYWIAYYIILAMGMICFPISVYFHKRRPWTSTILHGMVHILGNVSNFVLYSGSINKVYFYA